jgi:hypothetical protein
LLSPKARGLGNHAIASGRNNNPEKASRIEIGEDWVHSTAFKRLFGETNLEHFVFELFILKRAF